MMPAYVTQPARRLRRSPTPSIGPGRASRWLSQWGGPALDGFCMPGF